MTVRNLLSRKTQAIYQTTPDAPLAHAVDMLAENRIGAIVVCDRPNHLVGILSERDIVRGLAAIGPELLQNPVSSLMTTPVEVAKPDDDVNQVMQRMSAGRFRHMPIVEKGRLLGVVSIGDVVANRIRELEYETAAMRNYIATG